MSSSRLIITILWLALAPATFAATPVHEFTLANGLKVLVREDHRAPVVVSQVWYKVGSSYEPSGLTGISHLLEHLMFKGTPEAPGGEFSRLIAANPASSPPTAGTKTLSPAAITPPIFKRWKKTGWNSASGWKRIECAICC